MEKRCPTCKGGLVLLTRDDFQYYKCDKCKLRGFILKDRIAWARYYEK